MFPIGDVTQFELIIALIACIAALSTGYWRWATAALSVPVFYFGILARLGSDELGIGAATFLASYCVALIGGMVWGWGTRRMAGRRAYLALGLAVLPGIAFAGFALERQYVPAACRDNGTRFLLGGHSFTMPRIEGYWQYREKSKSLTEYAWDEFPYWNTKKQHMARFCELTQNAAVALDLSSVRVGQRHSGTEFNIVGPSNARPNWDWNNFPRAASHEYGSEAEGAECYTRASQEHSTFSCAVWDTPRPDFRIYAVSIKDAPEDPDATVERLRRDLSEWFNAIEIE